MAGKGSEAPPAAVPAGSLTADDFQKGLRLCHKCSRPCHWRTMESEKVYNLEEQYPGEWQEVIERWGTLKERGGRQVRQAGLLLPHDVCLVQGG